MWMNFIWDNSRQDYMIRDTYIYIYIYSVNNFENFAEVLMSETIFADFPTSREYIGSVFPNLGVSITQKLLNGKCIIRFYSHSQSCTINFTNNSYFAYAAFTITALTANIHNHYSAKNTSVGKVAKTNHKIGV